MTLQPRSVRRFRLGLMDGYLLRLTVTPLLACLGVTLIALLLERALHLLDVLSSAESRVGRVFQLTATLLPHFLGLALPMAFFIALFIVVTQLDDGSEIAAFLASGVPLTRLAAPLVAVAVVLTVFSLLVFGYLQPYSRYAYRAVFHAAVNAGWNGRLSGGAFVTQNADILTADSGDLSGSRLQHIFIRRLTPTGEDIITAQSAQLSRTGDTVLMTLHNGLQVHQNASGDFSQASFDTFDLHTDVAGATALNRNRGGDQRELTFPELVTAARAPAGMIPRRVLLAELYARLARSLILPFLPMMALPLGLAAKRGRRAAGLILASAVLVAFQYALQLGQGLAQAGRIAPEIGVWSPFLAFAAFCCWIFAGSRRRPGETPVSLLVQEFSLVIERVRPRRRKAERGRT